MCVRRCLCFFSFILVVCCLWNLFCLRSISQHHGICWAALRCCMESIAFQLVQMKEQGSVARTNSRLLVNLDTQESRCLGYLMAALILEFGSPTSSRRKGVGSSFHDPHIWLKWFSGLLLVWDSCGPPDLGMRALKDCCWLSKTDSPKIGISKIFPGMCRILADYRIYF